jgi:hypothetical protein
MQERRESMPHSFQNNLQSHRRRSRRKSGERRRRAELNGQSRPRLNVDEERVKTTPSTTNGDILNRCPRLIIMGSMAMTKRVGGELGRQTKKRNCNTHRRTKTSNGETEYRRRRGDRAGKFKPNA